MALGLLQPPFTALQAGLYVGAPHRYCSSCCAGSMTSLPGGVVKLVHQTQAVHMLQLSQLDSFLCSAGSKSRAA